MAKHIQYGVITATQQQLQHDGCQSLHPQQKVVIESVPWTNEIVMVKTSAETKAFLLMKRSYVQLKSAQLSMQF